MSDNFAKKDSFWIPERTFGVCVWVKSDGDLVRDGDNVLCAEGFVGDKKIEKAVADSARYWTGSGDGHVEWIHGARKVTSSEKDDQAERLIEGLTPDPYEDYLRGYN
jgi:hypothetical protein